MTHPFDAVLLIAFGGPQAPADIRPFLENVLRGRRVAPGRIDEVAHHYEAVGGRSPITGLTLAQARGLEARLAAAGQPLPVHVGMRNWHPFLADTLAEMSRAGVRRAAGVIAAAHRSYSSCTQYRENVAAARASLAERGLADVEVTFVGDWHTHAGFVAAAVDRIRVALRALDPALQPRAEIVFTAHSIPVSMAVRYPYQAQLEESARAVMTALGEPRPFSIVYQSRSGRPEDPWLGPDVCEAIREMASRGVAAIVVSPIGFVCDHVEVLYDLDIEAAAAARDAGLPLVRALAVNDHPRFLDALAESVLGLCRRYERARPLELVSTP